MGKPVIVSDYPSMEFVKKGQFGLVVEYGNIIQLKEALETILEDPELAKKLGQNGKSYVLENFSWNVVGRKVEDIYNQVAARHN
jgi:glycosyltransferase involved in cell wall biosynthesis